MSSKRPSQTGIGIVNEDQKSCCGVGKVPSGSVYKTDKRVRVEEGNPGGPGKKQ